MGRNPLTVSPPSWLDIDTYKQLLNRTAVTITKHAKKQGATYQVKEAIDAIKQSFSVAMAGRDPYDGLPLASRLLAGSRSPTVSEVSSTTTATFEILSLQTKEAKGERNAEDLGVHRPCRAVVAHADTTSTTTR